MRILAVDTTTPDGSVALLENGKLRIEVNWSSPVTHSSRLLKSVDFVLAGSGLEVGDVDGFACAVGPGSFTGIRIGVSAVKSLAFASGKPVASVSTLTALASKLSSPEGRLVAPVLDAKRGEIYAALFERQNSVLEDVVPQGAYDPENFLRRLPAQSPVVFVGSGLALHAGRFRDRLGERARLSPRSPFIAAEVALLGWRMIVDGKGVPSGLIEPLYFRRSQAEEKRRS